MLASGQLGSHNGLPVTLIVSTTLKELESGRGHAVTAGGSLLPMAEVIRQAAAAHHYSVVFDDHTECPPMLSAMKNGEFDALVCWHTDRLYRRMGDLETLIEIADAAHVQIKTVQGGELDLSTSAGRMVARILGSVSNQESEHKGERHRAANAQKAAAGKWQTANRCFGYTAKGEPLEPEATAFRTAVADVLAGKSINQVAREWNAAGLRTTLAGRTQKRHGKEFVVPGTWNAPRVRRLLINPRYAGLKVHQGKVVGPGDWEALIDETTHHGLVAFLSDPARIICTSFEKKYMGSGVYRCGVCGGPMRHAVPGGKKPGGRRYECRAKQHVVRVGDHSTSTSRCW